MKMDAVANLQALIRYQSFTPKNPTTQEKDFAECQGSLDFVEQLLAPLGCRSVKRLAFPGSELAPYPVDNLIVHLAKGESEETLFYSCHTDVVGLVDETLWTVQPFGAEIKDGFIHGRGVTDMKGGIISFIKALYDKLEYMPKYNIYFLVTTDEEWTGANGTIQAFRYLKEQGIVPTWVLVGEPASKEKVGDSVRYGRRGSLSGNLFAKGKSGHVAYPERTINPIAYMVRAQAAIMSIPFESDGLGREGTNLEFTYTNSGNPKDGGTVPQTAEANFNVRFTSNYSVESMCHLINKALDDAGIDRTIVTLTLLPQVASQPFTSKRKRLAECILTAAIEICGVDPDFNRAGGTSDGAKVYRVYDPAENPDYADIEIAEFGSCSSGGGLRNGLPAKTERGGIHEIDERAYLADLELLAEAYGHMLENLFR